VTPGRPSGTATPERLARELDRILEEVARGVDGVIENPHPTPASLHRLHREMRRLRTGLGVWEELLLSADRVPLRPLDQRIRRVTRLVGQVRDRDVALGLLEGVAHHVASRKELDQLNRYRARLRDDARTGRELLRAFLRAERQALLLDHVSEAVRDRSRTIRGSRLRRALAKHEVRERENVAAAHRRARKRPTMNRLHRLRIRVRRLRQWSDLATAVDPDWNDALANSLRRFQQHLGRLHDLDVLLLDLEPSLRKSGWAERLRKERRLQRRAILETLESLRLSRALAPPAQRSSRGSEPGPSGP
jgi:CHAD domain-containing protein